MIKDGDKVLLEKFGAKLNELRVKKKLSLRQLSYLSNLDHSTIAKIEKGSINITFTTLAELARALEVHPKELLDIKFD